MDWKKKRLVWVGWTETRRIIGRVGWTGRRRSIGRVGWTGTRRSICRVGWTGRSSIQLKSIISFPRDKFSFSIYFSQTLSRYNFLQFFPLLEKYIRELMQKIVECVQEKLAVNFRWLRPNCTCTCQGVYPVTISGGMGIFSKKNWKISLFFKDVKQIHSSCSSYSSDLRGSGEQ